MGGHGYPEVQGPATTVHGSGAGLKPQTAMAGMIASERGH